MTLKKYIEGLQKFIKENPDTLGMQVVTSRDDEGNGFNPVYFTPSKGIFEDRDFIPSDSNETNAVCVN